jgi:hypothetical protein
MFAAETVLIYTILYYNLLLAHNITYHSHTAGYGIRYCSLHCYLQ